MRKLVGGAGVFAACLVVAWTLWILTRIVAPELAINGVSVPRFGYAELIAVLLTGLAVALGILGIVVAGLALWGYRAIKDESRTIASRVSRSETRKRVLEHLRSPEVLEIVENEVARRLEELGAANQIASSFSKEATKASTLESGSESRVGRPFRKRKGAE